MTDYVAHHPGGPKTIVELAGGDGTMDFDRIHPPTTLERTLSAEAKIGRVDLASWPKPSRTTSDGAVAVERAQAAPLDQLLNLDDIEARATRIISSGAKFHFGLGPAVGSGRSGSTSLREHIAYIDLAEYATMVD